MKATKKEIMAVVDKMSIKINTDSKDLERKLDRATTKAKALQQALREINEQEIKINIVRQKPKKWWKFWV